MAIGEALDMNDDAVIVKSQPWYLIFSSILYLVLHYKTQLLQQIAVFLNIRKVTLD